MGRKWSPPRIGKKEDRLGKIIKSSPILPLSGDTELLDLAIGNRECLGCCAEVEQLGFGYIVRLGFDWFGVGYLR
jgi:hypothetical protein